MKMKKNKFSERLAELRNAAGLTQRELAKQLGVSYSIVASWASGGGTSFDNLLKITDYFEVSTDFLLGRTEI